MQGMVASTSTVMIPTLPVPHKNTDKAAWGPQLWHSLHMIALNYPDKPSAGDKLNYKLFFEALKDVIPCIACADNYAAHLHELPIDRYLDSAGSLFAWTVHVHNMVNDVHGKQKWTLQQALAFYSSYKGGCPPDIVDANASTNNASTTNMTTNVTTNKTSTPERSPRFHAAKDMLATWLMLLVTALIAITILLFAWFAFMYAKKLRR
jgi:hypothetical protein